MLRVIGVVAFLTQGAEVAWVAMLRDMVEMSNREDYLDLLACLRIEPHCVVLHSAELASVVGTVKD